MCCFMINLAVLIIHQIRNCWEQAITLVVPPLNQRLQRALAPRVRRHQIVGAIVDHQLAVVFAAVLDSEHPLLAARSGDALLDSWIFAGSTSVVREVVVGGRVIVQSGHHANEDAIARRFKDTLRKLFA